MSSDSTVGLLVSMIGEDDAIKLMDSKNFGGGQFEFPKSETGLGSTTYAALAEVIGTRNAQRLCQQFGGERLYIPNLSKQYRQNRNKTIVTKYNNGATVRELMREYGMSDRRIWEILKTTDMQESSLISGAQTSLF